MDSKQIATAIIRIYNAIPHHTVVGYNPPRENSDCNQSIICNICGNKNDHGENSCPSSEYTK